MSEQTLTQRYGGALMNTFGAPKLVLERGAGAHVWDESGKEYVDFLGGIAVNALGHGHPALVEAVTSQLQTLGHVSNFFATRPQVELAEKLLALLAGPDGLAGGVASAPEVAGRVARAPELGGRVARAPELGGRVASASERIETPGKVFFTNSGTEANEAAFKLTRRTGRTHLVAMAGGFHGRSMGALALTAKEAYRAPFAPLPGDVTFVPYGDAEALAAAVTDETAAIVIEPVQGEAGVVVPPEGFLAAARAIADEHGALLWLDEVQSGMGRTGRWFAHQATGVRPDVVTLAKGLGGGFPIGACIGLGAAGDLLQPGNHGTTFGGNPVACAAALAVIATIESDDLLEHATVLGHKLRDGLAADPRVAEVTGDGLFVGVVLTEPKSDEVAAAALRAGFIVNNATPTRIRLAPPLVVTSDDVDALLRAWPAILDETF